MTNFLVVESHTSRLRATKTRCEVWNRSAFKFHTSYSHVDKSTMICEIRLTSQRGQLQINLG